MYIISLDMPIVFYQIPNLLIENWSNNIQWYLKGIVAFTLGYQNGDLCLFGYSGIDYSSDLAKHKFTLS